MIKFKIPEIPIWVDTKTNIEFPGYLLICPPKKDIVWNRANVKYNDVMIDMFSQEIISCGLAKLFEVNERPDLVNVSPNLLNWKVYDESEQIIVSRFKGVTVLRRSNSFPIEGLINLNHHPEFKYFLEKHDTIDFSIIFQKVGFQFKVLTIIDHETLLPKPYNVIEQFTLSINLPMCREVGIEKLSILGKCHRRYAKNYILFMNSVAVRISNNWYASTLDFHDNIDINKLLLSWVEYPNRNFSEFSEKIRNIDQSLETKEDLNDIFCAYKMIGKFVLIIDAKIHKASSLEEKRQIISSLPASLQSVSWDLFNGKDSRVENRVSLYQKIISVFMKNPIDKAAA